MKKIFLILLLLIIIITNTSLLSSCNNATLIKYTSYSFDYFDTVTTITGFEKNEEEFNVVSSRILAELEEYHKLFTIYHRFENLENLCTINEIVDGEHRIVSIDKKIIDMLKYSKDIYNKTNGNVNIAMGSVLSIWHDYREDGLSDPANAKLPPMEKLVEASNHTNINGIIIDNTANTVYLNDPNTRLDVGAIAKGYAVEMIANSLETDGISGYVINVGGNVRTIGTKPDGEKWLVGIENPDKESDESYIAYLQLSGESLVTSGSYQRYYTVDNKNYHHIIDPETLMPSDNYLSVSVVCKSSADGDALSTALFNMSLDEGKEFINNYADAEAMWVTPDGEKHYSNGFLNYLKSE